MSGSAAAVGYVAVVGFGVLGAVLLAVFAWRAGRRTERRWLALARARGWHCERAAGGDTSLVLRGRAQALDWACRLRGGPSVITGQTPTRNITRLETVWSTALPASLRAAELNLYDPGQVARLRRMAQPALGRWVPALAGPAGQALRAGLQRVAAGEPCALPTGHVAPGADAEAVRRLASARWLAALERFARASAGRAHRVRLGPRRLEIAVLGSLGERDALPAFIDAAALLARATVERLHELAAGEAAGGADR